MKITVLGAGSWGCCLAALLASKGFQIVNWTRDTALAETLRAKREHPSHPGCKIPENVVFTSNLSEALAGADLVVESVTSAGLRPVLEQLPRLSCPLVITSKGIEQDSGLILPEVAVSILGEENRHQIAVLSGPSFASDVIRGLPTSIVGSSFSEEVMQFVCETFQTPTFRVYPNSDIQGVCFGGGLKNIIAIACGISDGLSLGASSKASLMTRGLHELRKLAVASGCRAETLFGLSGMGDIVLTCNSLLSRNFRFGHLLAQGMSPKEAEKSIEMVVEGVYNCKSALQLSQKRMIPMPITEAIHRIVYEGMKPMDAVLALMQRAIKEEHL